VTELLQNHNISLNANAKAVGAVNDTKTDEKKPGEQRKFVVQKETTSLFLQKNEFRTITGLYTILQDVMFNCNNLLWVDLSYNYLEKIEDEIV
jgi:sporulation protein YlmC with PRC-barrel domain